MVDKESGEVSEEGHAGELAESPFPRAGFTSHDNRGGKALQGIDEKDDDGEPNPWGV